MEVIENPEGIKELNIELGGYTIDIAKVDIKGKYKDKIREILLENSLALVDFIGIDTNYDGDTPPIISWQDYRTKDKLTIDSNIKITDRGLNNGRKYI